VPTGQQGEQPDRRDGRDVSGRYLFAETPTYTTLYQVQTSVSPFRFGTALLQAVRDTVSLTARLAHPLMSVPSVAAGSSGSMCNSDKRVRLHSARITGDNANIGAASSPVIVHATLPPASA
jgi:hypothetical protein